MFEGNEKGRKILCNFGKGKGERWDLYIKERKNRYEKRGGKTIYNHEKTA